jgi:hypothetical protein
MIPTYKVIPQYRLETKTTRSSLRAEMFDQPDADPLGWRRIITQVGHDLYGTKDVQDAITASYVWLADQIGHLSLGLLPTLLLGWFWRLLCQCWGLSDRWFIVGCVAIALGFFVVWVVKEKQDYDDTFKRAIKRFPFDSSDIKWNIKTALLYFGIGGLLALASFIGLWWLIGALLLSLWPVIRVACWWLRRKLPFQQAGLPYLYRLKRTSGRSGQALGLFQNVQSRTGRSGFREGSVRKDPVERLAVPAGISNRSPLRSGKTNWRSASAPNSPALGIGRYFSAAG